MEEGAGYMGAAEAAPAVAAASGIIPTLQNIVATVNLSCKLDLKVIAMGARNAEYNPKRFAAVIMRIREPKTTALIFASGKMVRTTLTLQSQATFYSQLLTALCSSHAECLTLQVCTGAKSEEASKLAARKVPD